MSKIDQVDEFADGVEEELLFLGEHDERKRFEPAILGIAHRFGMQPVVTYDYRKVIDIFAEDMSHEERGLEKALRFSSRYLNNARWTIPYSLLYFK